MGHSWQKSIKTHSRFGIFAGKLIVDQLQENPNCSKMHDIPFSHDCLPLLVLHTPRSSSRSPHLRSSYVWKFQPDTNVRQIYIIRAASNQRLYAHCALPFRKNNVIRNVFRWKLHRCACARTQQMHKCKVRKSTHYTHIGP